MARSTITGTPLSDSITVETAVSESGSTPDPGGISSTSSQMLKRLRGATS
jgi:hypothetical protein